MSVVQGFPSSGQGVPVDLGVCAQFPLISQVSVVQILPSSVHAFPTFARCVQVPLEQTSSVHSLVSGVQEIPDKGLFTQPVNVSQKSFVQGLVSWQVNIIESWVHPE